MARAIDKKGILREADRRERARQRQAVADLRAAVRAWRAARARAVAAAKKSCVASRLRARATCAKARGKAAEALESRRAASAALQSERDDQAAGRAAERRGRRRSRRDDSPATPRRETDAEVLANVPPETHALWETVKRGIRGSAHRSRSEEFLDYVQAHPSEVYAALEDDSERQLAELLRQPGARAGRPAPDYPASWDAIPNPSALSYRDTHEGDGGDYHTFSAHLPDWDHGRAVLLGDLHAVEYVTARGVGAPMETYRHEFGRGAHIVYHTCSRSRCPSAGAIAVARSTSTCRVTPRGIVG